MLVLLFLFCFLLNHDYLHVNGLIPFTAVRPLRSVKARKSNQPLFFGNDSDGIGSSNNNDDDDKFMSSLQSRIQTLKIQETKMPLLVLDAMLPRQILKLDIKNKLLFNLIQHRIKINENPTLGMLGKAILANGDVINLTKGVEVEISIIEEEDDDGDDDRNGNGNGNRDKDTNKNTLVEFKAGRRFKLDGEVEQTDEGWTEGRVSFLCSKEEEQSEIQQKIGLEDPVSSIANAVSKAKELTSPNLTLPNNVSLIDRWIELAKQNERQPGQINELLDTLGTLPNDSEPSEIAFYIGSLINPLPAMGVAVEIRPALLMAESAEERIQIAHDGILRSVRHMDGSARMW